MSALKLVQNIYLTMYPSISGDEVPNMKLMRIDPMKTNPEVKDVGTTFPNVLVECGPLETSKPTLTKKSLFEQLSENWSFTPSFW